MLLVVPFHVSYLLPAHHWLNLFHEMAGGVRMPLLLFICGLLTARSTKSSERITHLGWLFLIWTTILCTWFAAWRGVVVDAESLAQELVYPTTALWFVWALALMTASLAILRKWPTQTVIGAALISMTCEAIQPVTTGVLYVGVLSKAVFFYVGVFFGHRILGQIDARKHSILWLIPALFLLRLLDHFTVQALGWQVAGLVERMIAICLALYIAGLINRVPLLGWALTKSGRNTLPVFVGHGLFLPLGAALFGTLAPVPVAAAFITVFAIAGSIAVYKATHLLDMPWLYRAPNWVLDTVRPPLPQPIPS